MPATRPPIKTVINNKTGQSLTPIISATLVAKTLWFGKLLNKAMPNHNKKMAKKGCQKAIFPVLPIKPQVAKEMTTTAHHGKTICNKKEAMITTKKTMSYFFEIL